MARPKVASSPALPTVGMRTPWPTICSMVSSPWTAQCPPVRSWQPVRQQSVRPNDERARLRAEHESQRQLLGQRSGQALLCYAQERGSHRRVCHQGRCTHGHRQRHPRLLQSNSAAFHSWILVTQRLRKEAEASRLTLCFLVSGNGGQVQFILPSASSTRARISRSG